MAQVNFYCGFVSQKYRYVEAARRANDPIIESAGIVPGPRTPEVVKELAAAEARLEPKLPRPPLSDLIDHIDHMVKVAGVDHVGLGSDFDGIDCSPQGLDSAADLPKITEALYQRGYKAEDLIRFLAATCCGYLVM